MIFKGWLEKDRATQLGFIGAICSGFTLFFLMFTFLSLMAFLVGIASESIVDGIFRVFFAPGYALFLLGFPMLADLYGKFLFLGFPALGIFFGYLSTRDAKQKHQEIPKASTFALAVGWTLFGLGLFGFIGSFWD